MAQGIEVLAPAGNMEMLHAAVLAGADAVYLGLERFNARRTAGNFTIDALGQAVVFCHARGVRVHVTLNTTLYPAELPAMAQTIYDVAQMGADAVIVQDLAVARLVRTMAPGLALHGSTQMTVHSLAGARQLAALGFSRVILSRELSLNEIAHIAKNCGIEVEVFVHGALCMSASGQCYMSAFLGGRSGNRGGCAGPCRLPFDADASFLPALDGYKAGGAGAAACQSPATDTYHLSLKDMSHIARLPQLADAGVVSVKIEGRLRTPEYAAAAVNACRQALDGGAYDENLLRDVFSRSGFTDAYLTGRIESTMFGVRTQEDAAAARAAAPQLRELFRRERPRVPVCLRAEIEADGAKLTIEDADGNRALAYSGETEPQPAQKDQTENIQKALAKTGGTPFEASQPAQVSGGTWFLPASEWNEMRRKALDSLLVKRSKIVPHACLPPQDTAVRALYAPLSGSVPGVLHEGLESPELDSIRTPAPVQAQARRGAKKLFVQFETIAQMPDAWGAWAEQPQARAGESGAQGNSATRDNAADRAAQTLPQGIIVPLAEWSKLPHSLRARTWLALPRWTAGESAEDAVRQEVQDSAIASSAFAGYFVQNIAHVALCRGLPMLGAFGLNVTNCLAARTYADMGLCGVTLSPELLATDMAQIAQTLSAQSMTGGAAAHDASAMPAAQAKGAVSAMQTAALVYGHMPLMLTRACPLQNVKSCKGCSREGLLLDRKGKLFPVRCSAPAAAGMRTVYNPIPLYMGDKLSELPVDLALVQFTVETKKQAAQVLACVQAGDPFAGEFTRGLYFKGTQ